MSAQKGNAIRQRAQKHQNRTAFSNTLHDTSRLTKQLNSLEIHGVCARCRDIIQWKIKYKKYKPLSAPAVCARCHQRSVKQAYRHICGECASQGAGCCEKCGENNGQVVPRCRSTCQERQQLLTGVDRAGHQLSERQRRSLQRLVAASDLHVLQQLQHVRDQLDHLLAKNCRSQLQSESSDSQCDDESNWSQSDLEDCSSEDDDTQKSSPDKEPTNV